MDSLVDTYPVKLYTALRRLRSRFRHFAHWHVHKFHFSSMNQYISSWHSRKLYRKLRKMGPKNAWSRSFVYFVDRSCCFHREQKASSAEYQNCMRLWASITVAITSRAYPTRCILQRFCESEASKCNTYKWSIKNIHDIQRNVSNRWREWTKLVVLYQLIKLFGAI